MLLRTETHGSTGTAWVELGFTYDELVEKIGCSDGQIRKIVCESNGFKIEKGTRGRNGTPAIVWMSEPKLKSLIQEVISNKIIENKGEKKGRPTGDSSNCDLYSCFKTVDEKVTLFKGENNKPPKKIRKYDNTIKYEIGDTFFANDGSVCQVIGSESNFFVYKVDGTFAKVGRYHFMCDEWIIQSTKGELYALKDVYYVQLSKDNSTYNPTWIVKSRKDPCVISKEGTNE